MAHFVIVEDDVSQLRSIAEGITAAFPGAYVILFDCEGAFHQHFDAIVASPPDVFIIDMIVRWSDLPVSSPLAKAPSGLSSYRAGRRIYEMISGHPHLAHLPVIIYSTLEPERYEDEFTLKPDNLMLVAKTNPLKPLLCSLLPNIPRRQPGSWIERMIEATGASVKFAGLSIDLRQLLGKKRL